MNKYIKEQLKKCKVCTVPYFDEDTTDLIIPLYQLNATQQELILNHYYIIRLSSSVFNPPQTSVLASNWNKGVIPKSEYMMIMYKKSVGEMIQVDGCGWDNDRSASKSDAYLDLWLPRNAFSVIKELNV